MDWMVLPGSRWIIIIIPGSLLPPGHHISRVFTNRLICVCVCINNYLPPTQSAFIAPLGTDFLY